MKIYYASSIRGAQSKDLTTTDNLLIEELRKYGVVLNENLTIDRMKDKEAQPLTDKDIHDKQWHWIELSDVVVAEVTNPSLGVGYIIGRAVDHNKKVLCLYQRGRKKLSAMLRGNRGIKVHDYLTSKNAFKIIEEFFDEVEIEINKTPSIKDINKSTMHGLLTGSHG